MFERYTEKARRVIFFARYEAIHYGSRTIDTEHLLLGILREEPDMTARILDNSELQLRLREEIEKRIVASDRLPSPMEVPLSLDAKKILNLAMEEAQDFGQRAVGPEHLLLAILHFEKCLAAEILRAQGITLEIARKRLADDFPLIPMQRGRVLARQVLDAFLSGLKDFHAEEMAAFFSEKAQVVDFLGHTWIGRDEINFEACLAPFATKNARSHIERAESGPSDTFVAIVFWEDVTVAADAARSIHRMTIVLGREDGAWSIFALQVTPVVR